MGYERFTDDARKVMQVANQEAQRFNHPLISTEHLLFALLRDVDTALLLKKFNVDRHRIRRELEQVMQCGPEMNAIGKLPLTPMVERVLTYSKKEALELGNNYVGTEHLLLGLLRETESVAVQVLMNHGVKPEKVRQEVLNLLGNGSASGDGTE